MAVLALVALVGAAMGLMRYLYQATPPSEPGQSDPYQAITESVADREITFAVFSPGGRYLALVERQDGREGLRLFNPSHGSNYVQLIEPADVEYRGVTFSPDGNYVYYVVLEHAQELGVLYRVPAWGGGPRRLTEDVESAISVSPDGMHLAFTRNYQQEGVSALMTVSMHGGGERRLATRKFPDRYGDLAWSPDHQLIACAVSESSKHSSEMMGVVTVRYADGAERPLTARKWRWVGRLVWPGDGRGLLFVAEDGAAVPRQDEPRQVWRLTHPEGEALQVTSDANDYVSVSLTQDSRSLVAVHTRQVPNIWVAPHGEAGRATRITTSKDGNDGLGGGDWTPDGRIVYASGAGGDWDIRIMKDDGSDVAQLTFGAGTNISPSVSPDGRYVVFASNRAGAFNLWRMDTAGNFLTRLTHRGGEFNPVVSPDGRWVVYDTSGGADGYASRLWKVSIDGGNPVPLTDKYSFRPSVSPDGKWIAYFRLDEPGKSDAVIAVMPFAGGAPVKRFDIRPVAVAGFSPLVWIDGGRALTHIGGNPSNIYRRTLNGGERAEITEHTSEPIPWWEAVKVTDFSGGRIKWFGWSPDSKRLALTRVTTTNAVTLIDDYTGKPEVHRRDN